MKCAKLMQFLKYLFSPKTSNK